MGSLGLGSMKVHRIRQGMVLGPNQHWGFLTFQLKVGVWHRAPLGSGTKLPPAQLVGLD